MPGLSSQIDRCDWIRRFCKQARGAVAPSPSKVRQASLLSPSTTTMPFKALSSELLPERPLSQAANGWRSKLHPLYSRNGRNYIQSQFSISDWLAIGTCLQALIILISPYSVAVSLGPTFALAAYKIAKTILITCGLIANPHMNGVQIGRTTAIFPEADGGFERKIGDTFGGEGVCIMLLSTKCNQYVHPIREVRGAINNLQQSVGYVVPTIQEYRRAWTKDVHRT
jgi:hypothetical protein